MYYLFIYVNIISGAMVRLFNASPQSTHH